MTPLVISCSLNPDSHSHRLARHAAGELQRLGATVAFADLRDHALPICDGQSCTNPSVDTLSASIRAADAVLLAVPIYNYDVNAAAKNLVEHTGKAWENKTVAFLAAAGGHGSYMSVMSLANSLMLDFRCLVIPRFVYATGHDFDATSVTSPKIRDRITQLCTETLRITNALQATAQRTPS
jgi:FMN reductase